MISIGLAIACEAVGVPAAWIFAFLIVFGIYAIFGDRQVSPPRKAMIPSQVIIALLCTAPLTTTTVGTIVSYAGPTVISLVVTLSVCALAAWLLVRVHRTSPQTAVLSTLAGGASAMVMLSTELKADTRFVTLTQYLRVSIVVLTLPAIVGILGSLGGTSSEGSVAASDNQLLDLSTSWQGVVGCLVVGCAVWAFTKLTSRWFTISSPYLLVSIAFAMIAVMVFGVPHAFITPDGVLVKIAYALIGVQAGGTLTKGALRQFIKALPIIISVIALMIGLSIVTAFVIAGLWNFRVLDAYLATVPGGIYAVLAFAHDAGSAPIVTVIQVMRMITMLVVGAYAPQIIRLLFGRQRAS
nr:AbrB family transcriptional regulator [Corynebacterium falsenii]